MITFFRMNNSSTSTVLIDSADTRPCSRYLGSISPSKRSSSIISKTYKQAQNLFLTRRLLEAFQALQPIIALQKSKDEQQEIFSSAVVPPIAGASRGARIKVWNLYLTLLNSILELDADERKIQFGSTEWRSIASKVGDGSVWEEVVQAGYRGVEGDVDPDVVFNLYGFTVKMCSR